MPERFLVAGVALSKQDVVDHQSRAYEAQKTLQEFKNKPVSGNAMHRANAAEEGHTNIATPI